MTASSCGRLSVVLVALLASALFGFVEICRGRLVQVAAPDHWRELAEAGPRADVHLGPFVMAGQLMLQKYGLGWTDAKLYDPELCASSGVELDSWFEHGPEPVYSRSPTELHLRQSADGVFVVAGAAWVDAAPAASQLLVVAFRRELGLRPSFVSAVGARVVAALVVGLGCALWGWRAGRRVLDPRLSNPSAELHAVRQLARSRNAGRLAMVALIVAVSFALWPLLRALSYQLY